MKPLVILDSNLREEGSINFATDTLATVIQEPLHEQEKRLPEKAVGHHEDTKYVQKTLFCYRYSLQQQLQE